MQTKNYLMTVLAMIIWTVVYGQQKLSAKYGTILSYGVGDSQGIDFNSTLEYDGYNSIYTYQKKSLENGEKTLSKIVFSKERTHMVQMRLDDVGEWTLVDHQTDGSMSRSVIGAKGYLINRDHTNQKWTLIDEEKEILGYNCQKATTYYAKELTFLEVPLVKHLMVVGQPVNPEK